LIPLVDLHWIGLHCIGLHCIALHWIALEPTFDHPSIHALTGFEWSPSNHRLIARSYHKFTRNVIELMMIRDMPQSAAGMLSWLPNELMFEIFRALFDLYLLDHQ